MNSKNHPSLAKEKALYEASEIIKSRLLRKSVFLDFDAIYGTGVIFSKLLTREEVEELYISMGGK